MKKCLSIIFLLSFILLSLSMVSAVPPFQSTTVAPSGLEIEATNSLYLKANTTHTFHFRVYNASNGVYISPADVTCSIGILDNYGNYIFNTPDATAVGFRYDVEVLGGNFTDRGVYHKGINCLLDSGLMGGVLTQSFEVTTTGNENPEGIVIVTFSILLLIIFVLLAVGIMKAIGLMIEGNFDLLDVGYSFGIYFGLLGLNLLAQIYLGNYIIQNFLELFVKLLAFPLMVVPVLAFFISLFRGKKENERNKAQW